MQTAEIGTATCSETDNYFTDSWAAFRSFFFWSRFMRTMIYLPAWKRPIEALCLENEIQKYLCGWHLPFP
ncbi:MAG: hypothetical protein LH618_05655, partial [Saprospiraceae bacterium]|nr:hypothetical protein [Saprospiraceae bacterium]